VAGEGFDLNDLQDLLDAVDSDDSVGEGIDENGLDQLAA
jgi:hypothetical protein